MGLGEVRLGLIDLGLGFRNRDHERLAVELHKEHSRLDAVIVFDENLSDHIIDACRDIRRVAGDEGVVGRDGVQHVSDARNTKDNSQSRQHQHKRGPIPTSARHGAEVSWARGRPDVRFPETACQPRPRPRGSRLLASSWRMTPEDSRGKQEVDSKVIRRFQREERHQPVGWQCSRPHDHPWRNPNREAIQVEGETPSSRLRTARRSGILPNLNCEPQIWCQLRSDRSLDRGEIGIIAGPSPLLLARPQR